MALLATAVAPAWSQAAAEPPVSTIPSAAPSTPAPDAPASSFVLRELRLPPTVAVSGEELRQQVQPYMGKTIGPKELSEIVERLRKLYEDRGYGLSAIGLPTQDVTTGTLQLAIVEPTINRVSVARNQKPPLTDTRVRGVLAFFGLSAPGLLNLQQLDRAMFALNDLPGVSAKATLGPTGDEGRFDVVIELDSRRAWDAQLEFDNHGTKVSGEYRLGGLLRWNNPLGIGDNLDLRTSLTSGRGVEVGRLGYELPLMYSPARLGLGLSRVSYELGDQFAALGATGTANSIDATVSYPFIRERERNLLVRVGWDSKSLTDRTEATGLETEVEKRLNGLVLGANYEGRDSLGGGGYIGAALTLRSGRLKFKNAADDDTVLGERATAGSFRKIEVQVTRLQGLTRNLNLFVGLTAQSASKNLDGSEKITLGGPKGVRAYPRSEAASDSGTIFSTELRWALSPAWTLFALADVGRGKTQKRPALPEDPDDPNTRKLSGSGFGVYFSDPSLFTLTATFARRGSEPVQSESKDSKSRVFLQVNRAF
jgi:hemolysin activation/secretion protein